MFAQLPRLHVRRWMILLSILLVMVLVAGCQPATPTATPVPSTPTPAATPTSQPPTPTSQPPTPAPTMAPPTPAPTPSAGAFAPVAKEMCDQVQGAVEHALGVKASQRVEAFADPVSGEQGKACAIEVKGTGKEFASPMDVLEHLGPVFTQMGWKEDMTYQASGPTGEATAYRSGNNIAFLLAQWKPAKDANCPKDQPISQCDLKPEQKLYTITLHLARGMASANMPNPASAYCEKHGGKLEIRKDQQGNEYGVCVFSDGSECEEWSFFRGECQPGQQTSTPERIVFAPGATSASMEGTVPDQGKVEFVLKAQKGQEMILDLSSAPEDVFLGIVTDDGYPLVRPVAGARHWMGELPKSGDYHIEVAAMRKGGPFSLFVQIPRWITFPKGSHSATLKGEVKHGQMVDYLLKGKKGQHLKVTVQSPNDSTLLNIVALENGMPMLRYVAESTQFDDVLPYDDLYLISVFGGAPKAVKYTLTVSVTESGKKAGKTYDDPFAYCKAVGTVDAPDERYTGEKVPPSIVTAIRDAAGISKDAPDAWVAQGTFWRCMDGQVWGCFVGANIPCTAKADTRQTPTDEMTSYCEEHPDAKTIPASVTGRATVYEWRCKGKTPEVVKQVFHADKQGFIAEFWYPLTSPQDSSSQ